MSGTTPPGGNRRLILREEYTARINKVIDYIEGHLGEDLSLPLLARVACFSPFHFHRIFGAMMDESLNHFIQRIRIEKAASMLASRPKAKVIEIALDCGFSSSAAFARVFREYFHMNARTWRAGGCAVYHKNGKVSAYTGLSRNWGIISQRFDNETRNAQWLIRFRDEEPVLVEVREMPSFHVAYVRYVGRYQGMAEVFAGLFNKLMKWAGPRGLLRDPGLKILAVYHDDPDITDDDRLRTSACITVPKDTEVSGEVGTMTLPGGPYAVGRFQLTEKDYADAWYAVMGGWLPESGYQPDDRYCYELFPGDSSCDCQGRTTVDICLPVRPL